MNTQGADDFHHIMLICEPNGLDPATLHSLQDSAKHMLHGQLHVISTVADLLEIMGGLQFTLDLIIIDIAQLYDTNEFTVFDVVNTLHTLARYNRHNLTTNSAPPPIAIGVRLSTAPARIRDVLAMGGVTGLYPLGEGVSIDEKTTSLQELLGKKRHIPKSVHAKLTEHNKPIRTTSTSAKSLTPRQSQIFDLIVTRGASNKAIANLLHITDSTVKLHMTAILKKYGVRTRTQLAVFSKNSIRE